MGRAERAALLGSPHPDDEPEEQGEDDRGPWSWTVRAGALSLLVAAALLGGRMLSGLLGVEAGERAAAALVALAGGVALWAVARGTR